MVVTGCQENKSCSKFLNFLERLDDRIRCIHEETVAVVNSSNKPTVSVDINFNIISNVLLRHNVCEFTGVGPWTGPNSDGPALG